MVGSSKQGRTVAGSVRIGVAATFVAESLTPGLGFWGSTLGVPFEVEWSPYGQFFQELRNPDSRFSRGPAALRVLLVRLEDWAGLQADGDELNQASQPDRAAVERNGKDLVEAVASLAHAGDQRLLVVVCPVSPEAWREPSLQAFYTDREREVVAGLRQVPGVTARSSEEVLTAYPGEHHYPEGLRLAHIPYREELFAALATLVAREAYRTIRPPLKLVVVDCDQTLWDGVCAEDGPEALRIGPARALLQERLLELQQSGVLLALSSKNAEADVLEVFQTRSDMKLRLEHFVGWKVNWRSKSEQIRELIGELGLGPDAVVFLDDNPAERAEVQAALPQVLVPSFPQVAHEIPGFLARSWAFDLPPATAEDQRRTELYREGAARDRARSGAASYQEFLEGLQLEVALEEMEARHFPRAAQLIARTNQFNLAGTRRTIEELTDAVTAGQLRGRVCSVRDRFGDYGAVGLTLFRADGPVLEVDTFLLSCRALGRGIERRMLADLGRTAQELGADSLALQQRELPRNDPARAFLAELSEGRAMVPGAPFVLGATEAVAISPFPSVREDTPSSASDAPTTFEGQGLVAPLQRIEAELLSLPEILAAMPGVGAQPAPRAGAGSGGPGEPESDPQVVCEIVERLLGVPRVSPDDDFLRCGGDSLTALALREELSARTGAQLSLDSIFDARTLRELAALAGPAASAASRAVVRSDPAERGAWGEAASYEPLADQEIGEQSGTRYGWAALPVAPLGRSGAIVRVPGSEPRLVPAREGETLLSCRGFATLAEHAGRIRESSPGQTGLPERLGDLVRDGWLVSQEELLSRLPAAEAEPTRIRSVAIPTRNRVGILRRSLASWLQNRERHGRESDFLIAENSADEEVEQSCRSMLAEEARRHRVSIRFIGEEERRSYATRLAAESGVPAEIVRFALLDLGGGRSALGANLNGILLDTAGEAVFKADDDLFCRPTRVPGAVDELRVRSGTRDVQHWFYPDRAAALGAAPAGDCDLLSAHEELLGRTLESVLRSRPVQLLEMERDLQRRLLEPGATVATSLGGMVGDCAWGPSFGYWTGPAGLLLLDGESRDRLLASEEVYRSALASREMLRGTDGWVIGDASLSFAAICGLDNRSLLPPFVPTGRGQDLVFGASLWHCNPVACFGHVPWCLPHEPDPPRRFPAEDRFRTATSVDGARLFLECIRSLESITPRRDVPGRIRSLGRFLQELGGLDAPELVRYLQQRLWESTERFLVEIDRALQEARPGAHYWKRDLTEYRERLLAGVTQPEYWIPLDLVDTSSADSPAAMFGSMLRSYGALLVAWPDLISSARSLRSRGFRLSVSVVNQPSSQE